MNAKTEVDMAKPKHEMPDLRLPPKSVCEAVKCAAKDGRTKSDFRNVLCRYCSQGYWAGYEAGYLWGYQALREETQEG